MELRTFDPSNSNTLYLTTEYDGLWRSVNIHAPNPVLRQVRSYGFRHPMRVLFNPYDPTKMWITSFGNGMVAGAALR